MKGEQLGHSEEGRGRAGLGGGGRGEGGVGGSGRGVAEGKGDYGKKRE